MELQTILEEERESIRSRFTAAESAPEAKEAFTKALEKLLYRYTEETKEEALKTAASHMFAAAKAYICGAMDVTCDWAQADMPYPAEELIDWLCEIMPECLKPYCL